MVSIYFTHVYTDAYTRPHFVEKVKNNTSFQMKNCCGLTLVSVYQSLPRIPF